MLKELKNKMLQAAIVMGGLFTAGSALTSCDEMLKTPEQEGKDLVHKRNPTADSITASPYENMCIKEEYAERRTDSAKIKLIREKYQFRLTQYQQALDSLKQMQSEIDATLLQAAAHGDLEGVKTALENGADVNAQGEKSGNTALMNAIEHCSDTKKAFDIAMYLLGEPSVRTKIENKRGISAVDLVNAKLNSGHAEWETIARKFGEPTTDNSRQRGNSELDKFANQVKETYNQLAESYCKEMRAALGYVYMGKDVHQNEKGEQIYIIGGYGSEFPAGMEITTNEDGSKDTTAVNPYAVHPTVTAKLLLREPHEKYLVPEEIGTQVVHKSRRKGYGIGHRYHKTVIDTYTVTTTRDGQQHVVQTGRGR